MLIYVSGGGSGLSPPDYANFNHHVMAMFGFSKGHS
jgi:hypothetical protein